MWILLLWAFLHKFLHEYIFLFMVGLYLAVELVSLCSVFWDCLPMWPQHFIVLPRAMKAQIFPHPNQHLLLFVFFALVVLVDVNWYLTGDFICTSLPENGVEILSCVRLLAICISSLKKYPFSSFSNLQIVLLSKCESSSFYVQVPYQVYNSQIFSIILRVIFSLIFGMCLLAMSSEGQKFFILIESN